MKRTTLAIAVVATTLATDLLVAVRYGDCKEEQNAEKCAALSSSLFSSQVSSDTETKFVMQWDDASKKLLFDGQAISHDTRAPIYDRFSGGTIRGFRFRDASSIDLAPATDRPDEYSLDVGIIGNLASLSDSIKRDGRLHYHVQWDDSKNSWVFEDPRTQEVYQSFVDRYKAFSEPYYSSFNSPLDLVDTYRSYRR